MNQKEINNFFEDGTTVGIKTFKFEKALKPLDNVFDNDFDEDDDNTALKRFNELNSIDQHKALNLKFISHSYDLDDIYISVVKDNTEDVFIIFYHVYQKYIHNYNEFIEIEANDDIATVIVTKILDNESIKPDWNVVEEKTIYE